MKIVHWNAQEKAFNLVTLNYIFAICILALDLEATGQFHIFVHLARRTTHTDNVKTITLSKSDECNNPSNIRGAD